MKRLFSKTLAIASAAALLTANSAMAATVMDYTLEEKLEQQLISSGLTGTVSFTAEGTGFFGMDDTAWNMVRTLLPRLSFDITSTVRSAKQEDRETIVTVKNNSAVCGEINILTDGMQTAFSSSMLQPEAWYSVENGADLTSFFWTPAEGQWPEIWHMLYEIASADSDWQDRMKEHSENYLTKLGIWFQNYQEITMAGEGEEDRIILHCEIPGQDLKTEMKMLMVDLSADEAMLALLTEIFTPEEAAAYLHPSMLNTFFAMLDNIDIEGSVVVDRSYDRSGVNLTDRITLPFTESYPVSYLTVGISTEEEGAEYELSGAFRIPGDEDGKLYPFLISMIPVGSESAFSGSLSIAYPLPDDEFEVETDNDGTGYVECEFVLGLIDGEEIYIATEDQCRRERGLTLTLRPITGDTSGIHTLSLSASLVMVSKSSRKAATNIQASLTVTDQDTESVLGLEANLKTAAKWTPTLISDLNTTLIRLDAMTAEQRQTVFSQWQNNLAVWFAGSWLTGIMQSASAR